MGGCVPSSAWRKRRKQLEWKVKAGRMNEQSAQEPCHDLQPATKPTTRGTATQAKQHFVPFGNNVIAIIVLLMVLLMLLQFAHSQPTETRTHFLSPLILIHMAANPVTQ